MMLDFGIVKWINSLDTDGKKLFAFSTTTIFVLLGVIGYLFVRIETAEERKDEYWTRIIAEKEKLFEIKMAASDKKLSEQILKTEQAQQSTKDCMTEKLNIYTNLYQEQRDINQRSVKVDKTQLSLANDNSNTVKVIKKNAKELVKIIDQKK